MNDQPDEQGAAKLSNLPDLPLEIVGRATELGELKSALQEKRVRVLSLHGAEGVGKTTLLMEAVEGIEARGRCVVALAQSADASRGVLREEAERPSRLTSRLAARGPRLAAFCF